MLFAAMFVAGSGDAVADDTDPFGIGDKFESYGLALLDPDEVREDLSDGRILLVLGDETYDLLMTPKDDQTSFEVHKLSEDGMAEHEETRMGLSFVGHVVGHEDRRASIQITQTGVDGSVRGGHAPAVYFEAARFHDPSAPHGVSIVYHPDDVRLMEGFGTSDDVIVAEPQEDIEEVIFPQSHSSGPDRAMNLWADPEMPAAFGTAWADRAWSVYNELDALFFLDVRFQFSAEGIYYCATASCASTFGMTSYDPYTLLPEWTNRIDNCGNCAGYELAHLMTGKELNTGTIGVAYRPGNTGLSQMVDAGGSYQGGTSTYEASLLMMHEVGHNFNGQHERAVDYFHRHCGFTLVICLFPSSWTHYTTMYTPFSEHPQSNKEMLGEFSADTTDGNWHWIRSCNASSWTKGSYGTYCRS